MTSDDSYRRAALGAIFLSHSSPDKPFVRKLDAALRSEGWDTWLDEHALVAGDSLPGSISEALAEAKVIIVVMSEYSVASNWVKFELRHATSRMIKNECRIIPILRADVQVPHEFEDLLYVDYRPGTRGSLRRVKRALEKALSEIPVSAKLSLRDSWDVSRKDALDEIVSSIFLGGIGRASSNVSATRSVDFDVIDLPGYYSDWRGNKHERSIGFHQIWLTGYGPNDIGIADWKDWVNSVENDYHFTTSLLIACDGEVSDKLKRHLRELESYLWVGINRIHAPTRVLLDLNDVDDHEEASRRVTVAYQRILTLVDVMTDGDWANF